VMHLSTSGFAAPLFERLLAVFVNRAFAAPLARGDLGFLEGHRFGVQFEDCGVHWVFTLHFGRLRVLPQRTLPEVSIRARTTEFIMLAKRQVDADTLFFQQRLVIDGDVALGLALKNFLDALDLDELPWLAKITLHAGDRLLSDTRSGSG
jgi:O2-independent ubiquinone biosynthesis accessory factor UbiT